MQEQHYLDVFYLAYIVGLVVMVSFLYVKARNFSQQRLDAYDTEIEVPTEKPRPQVVQLLERLGIATWEGLLADQELEVSQGRLKTTEDVCYDKLQTMLEEHKFTVECLREDNAFLYQGSERQKASHKKEVLDLEEDFRFIEDEYKEYDNAVSQMMAEVLSVLPKVSAKKLQEILEELSAKESIPVFRELLVSLFLENQKEISLLRETRQRLQVQKETLEKTLKEEQHKQLESSAQFQKSLQQVTQEFKDLRLSAKRDKEVSEEAISILDERLRALDSKNQTLVSNLSEKEDQIQEIAYKTSSLMGYFYLDLSEETTTLRVSTQKTFKDIKKDLEVIQTDLEYLKQQQRLFELFKRDFDKVAVIISGLLGKNYQKDAVISFSQVDADLQEIKKDLSQYEVLKKTNRDMLDNYQRLLDNVPYSKTTQKIYKMLETLQRQ